MPSDVAFAEYSDKLHFDPDKLTTSLSSAYTHLCWSFKEHSHIKIVIYIILRNPGVRWVCWQVRCVMIRYWPIHRYILYPDLVPTVQWSVVSGQNDHSGLDFISAVKPPGSLSKTNVPYYTHNPFIRSLYNDNIVQCRVTILYSVQSNSRDV